MPTRFSDRADAGRELARRLAHLRDARPIVLALPRGGVPVAYEVARALQAPIDVLNVRKLGVPWHEELALGAVATGGVRVLNDEIVRAAGVSAADLDSLARQQQIEIDHRDRLYREGRPAPALRGRTVILVDDGIATGATVRAAIQVVRSQAPARLVLAAPVAQASVAEELAREVDELVCPLTPSDLYAVGLWYEHFPQLRDDEVRSTLRRAIAERGADAAPPADDEAHAPPA